MYGILLTLKSWLLIDMEKIISVLLENICVCIVKKVTHHALLIVFVSGSWTTVICIYSFMNFHIF